jgi:hypothetical protein
MIKIGDIIYNKCDLNFKLNSKYVVLTQNIDGITLVFDLK